jgi:hypothetical protein
MQLIRLLPILALASCASSLDRTSNDLWHVRIESVNLAREEFQVFEGALQRTRRFFVVDRSDGLKAIKAEREFQATEQTIGPNINKAFHGAGAVLKASSLCQMRQGFLGASHFARCQQTITLVGPNGMLLHSATAIVDGPDGFGIPEWDTVLEQFLGSIKAQDLVISRK